MVDILETNLSKLFPIVSRKPFTIFGFVCRGQLKLKKNLQAKTAMKWERFQDNQQKLTEGVLALQGKIQEVIILTDNCQQLPSTIKELYAISEAHESMRSAKDNLISEGKALMAEDENNVTNIQNILTSIDTNWDKVNNMLKSCKDNVSDINESVQKFNQVKEKVNKAIKVAGQKAEQEDISNDLTQATIAYEKSKKRLDSLNKSKYALDQLEAKALDIVKKAENLPSFDVSDIKEHSEAVKKDWIKAQESLNQSVQNLEAEMVIWKQIDEAKNNLLQWVGETNAALVDATESVGSDTSLAQLAVYKSELDGKKNLHTSIKAKTKQLHKKHKGAGIPTLASLNKLLDEEFEDIAQIAKKLEDAIDTIGKNEKKSKDDIRISSDQISRIRESLMKCDNLTGENSMILERLNTCKGLKSELTGISSYIDSISKSVQLVRDKCPSFSNSPVTKELSGLKKRYSSVVSHANKVEKVLLAFLIKCHKEKASDLKRNLATHKEKVVWCQPDPGSDKYKLEAKITSINELAAGISDCESKKLELGESLKMLINVEDVNFHELKEEHCQIEKDYEELKTLFSQTKNYLDNNLDLCKNYDKKCDEFTSWLKDVEGKVKAQGGAQTDLEAISKKMKQMKKFKQEIVKRESELKEVEKLGLEMVKQSPESRISHNIGQVSSRYQTVKRFVDNYIERLQTLEKNVSLFGESVKNAKDWVEEAKLKLTNFDDAVKSGSKPSLYQEKLAELKVFTVQREAGQMLLTKAVEQGEALFPEIAPANRESVRSQLRNLRDSSEALIDKANSITKRIESLLMQRSSFDDSYSQVSQWIGDIDAKIGDKIELKSTLPDKKVALHSYKTLAQDINSHQAIFKQLQDKIAVLSDSETTAKFDEIMDKYKNVSKKVEDRVSASEKHVVNHESYIQAEERFRDFMNILMAEEAKSDKDATDSRLAILEDLLLQKGDGDKLLDVCDKKLKTVVKQTSTSGHSFLIGELEELKKAWKEFINHCTDNLEKLKQLSNRWTQFADKLKQLESWLKQKESQVKDQSLRSSEEVKQQHLEKLKGFEEEIKNRSDEISSLNDEVAEAGPELIDKVAKLSARYQALKTQAKVSKDLFCLRYLLARN